MNPTEPFCDLIDNLIDSGRARLPVFDATAACIQQEISKEEPNVRLIEKLITRDQALTARVLRVSNSSFYKGLTQVSTIRNAIVRLGINEVSNIVMMITHETNFRSKNSFIHGIMRDLWRHSLGTALAAHWLSKHVGLAGIAHETFFAGLLHDVGKLFILTAIDDLIHADKLGIQPSGDLIAEAMDSLHADKGYELMTQWNLPERYAVIARDHHRIDFDSDNLLECMVRLANMACNQMGAGLRPGPEIALVATVEARALHLSDVDIAQLQIHLIDASVFQPAESGTLRSNAKGGSVPPVRQSAPTNE